MTQDILNEIKDAYGECERVIKVLTEYALEQNPLFPQDACINIFDCVLQASLLAVSALHTPCGERERAFIQMLCPHFDLFVFANNRLYSRAHGLTLEGESFWSPISWEEFSELDIEEKKVNIVLIASLLDNAAEIFVRLFAPLELMHEGKNYKDFFEGRVKAILKCFAILFVENIGEDELDCKIEVGMDYYKRFISNSWERKIREIKNED